MAKDNPADKKGGILGGKKSPAMAVLVKRNKALPEHTRQKQEIGIYKSVDGKYVGKKD